MGFRTPAGALATVQPFKTIELPRLVRGKPHAWDPLVCLDWGYQLLSLLKNVAMTTGQDSGSDADALPNPAAKGSDKDDGPHVWRVKFVPGSGVHVAKLDPAGVRDVENGEDRVGFLPRWYWDDINNDVDARPAEDQRRDAPPPVSALA